MQSLFLVDAPPPGLKRRRHAPLDVQHCGAIVLRGIEMLRPSWAGLVTWSWPGHRQKSETGSGRPPCRIFTPFDGMAEAGGGEGEGGGGAGGADTTGSGGCFGQGSELYTGGEL